MISLSDELVEKLTASFPDAVSVGSAKMQPFKLMEAIDWCTFTCGPEAIATMNFSGQTYGKWVWFATGGEIVFRFAESKYDVAFKLRFTKQEG